MKKKIKRLWGVLSTLYGYPETLRLVQQKLGGRIPNLKYSKPTKSNLDSFVTFYAVPLSFLK